MTDQGNAPTWIVVATTTIPEAMMITERLRSLGIPAAMHREVGANVFAFTIGAYGQAKVLVPESFFNQAAGLLEAGDEELDDDDQYPEQHPD